jgi:plasmid segregation protein ParM
MDRYLAIDSGKNATKVAIYDPEKNSTKKLAFLTKIGDGDFSDDSIESGTFLAEMDGKVYKVGKGAKFNAELETSKMTDIHKICTLSAIAMCLNADEENTVHVAIGIPVKEFENVEKRNAYRNFILPDGEISVKLKPKNGEEPKTVKFTIKTKLVAPESSGVLYLNPTKFQNTTTATVDIGSLNVNGSYWSGFDLDSEFSMTGELGSQILIAGLAQELSAEFSRCDEKLVASILRQPLDKRHLTPIRQNPEVEQRSAEFIHKYLVEHVRKIKALCNAKNWSLDYMELVFIGGTSKMLENELYEVFGHEIYIAPDPVYANVLGFLTKLCSKTLKIVIPDAIEVMDKMNASDVVYSDEDGVGDDEDGEIADVR